MRLTMDEKRTIIKIFANKYNQARKSDKTAILDEFIQMTNFNRNYACRTLRDFKPVRRLKKRRNKKVIYGSDVKEVLEKMWAITDYICSKRLAAAIPELTEKLLKFKEIQISKETQEKLNTISASSIERLLGPSKKSRHYQKDYKKNPGKFLVDQIPLKTFGEWKNTELGYTQLDLVEHNGGDPFGGFFYTLNATDVSTGWTVSHMIKAKTKIQSIKGLYKVKKTFPFALKGIHTDNGSEFINEPYLAFCKKFKIKFTRSRPYKKNDSCYIEQKNYSIIRRNVGYLRYYTDQHAEILNELYTNLNQYSNFFQPVMMLLSKTRDGAKVYRKYDKPKTPFHRLLENPDLSPAEKKKVQSIYEKLNPAELKRKINKLQNKLIELDTYTRKSRVPDEKRQRRRKVLPHMTPTWRRENRTKHPNPFLEKINLEKVRTNMKKVWEKRK